jgi:hypothetical protein
MIASGFKVGGSKGKCIATQGEFILICATSNRKIYINIFVSKTIVDWIPQTTEKTLTVTVTKANTGGNPDDNGALRITTADAFSTPENNPNMVILLIWILVGATSFRSVTVTVMVLLTEDLSASLAVIITE